ncbi:hypothetical protein [Sphingobacterium chuzhouense]|uniref:BIG2 domain-containing protein n=1 Tax=Sphingobacterium chuzhouense TaxID=1742264 RepID=A0ABR7XRJ5_9SPHI|nr:hypothetical protein [Sphingobacterium chuzhouense]MBD1421800.1 hypothetical protein [Sphingobacterium chuzhouense]
MKRIFKVFAMVLLAGLLWSCEKDMKDSLSRLQLDNTDVTITSINTPVVLTITSGNGGYTVQSEDEGIVTAEISETSVILTATGEGTTRIFVTDSERRSVAVSVKVTFTLPDSEIFIWNGAVTPFDTPDGYGISILSSSIALTDLVSEEKKQIVLSWNGGLTVGDKTSGSLTMLTAEDVETVPLTSVKILRADASGHYIVFGDGTRSGECFVKIN